MELWILFLMVIVFAIAAFWWGVDSRDDIDSPEWERRKRRGHAL